jgi:hypothetical protein
MKKKSYLIICALVLNTTLLKAQVNDTNKSLNSIGYEKLMVQLNKYKIHFDTYKRDNIPLLMGNSEIGGLADPLGKGFYETWGNSFWWDSITRKPMPGLMLRFPAYEKLTPSKLEQNLSLNDGVLRTKVLVENGQGYESEQFFSMDDKKLFVIKMKNLSDKNIYTQLRLPVENFRCSYRTDNIIKAQSDENAFTPVYWKLSSNQKIIKSFLEDYTANLPNNIGKRTNNFPYCQDTYEVIIPANDSLIITYSISSQDDYGADHQVSYNQLYINNKQAWSKLWHNTGVLILPDSKYAEVFYRSLFWLYCTSGSSNYLPGETQYAEFNSNMALEYGYYSDRFPLDEGTWYNHSFTYGAPGWATLAFINLGNREKAKNILEVYYRPEQLNNNARISFPSEKEEIKTDEDNFGLWSYLNKNSEAWYFGHELSMNGKNLYFKGHRWDWQVHLNAFGAALFHKYGLYYPEKGFISDTLYSVMKGTAQFWSELLKWDEVRKAFILPPLLSLTEDLFKKNVIDAALAAKWNLNEASKWAGLLNRDKELSKIWKDKASKVYLQQNERTYLEYLDDDRTHIGGGYQGIRGFVYLVYPTVELLPYIDVKKAIHTLDLTWIRNKKGEGMINFVTCWFALADAYLKNAKGAYEKSLFCTTQLDPSGTAMMETLTSRPYYLDSYAAFVLVPISMCLQSYNNTIRVFPAIPEEWRDIEFYNLPAVNGIRVSGVLKNGKVKSIIYSKDGIELLKSNTLTNVQVYEDKGKTILKELND